MSNPARLSTGWVKLAEEGFAADNREIKKEWLKEVADSYSLKVYQSQINYKHSKWGTYGRVLEVKLKTENGKACLYGRLEPNQDFIELNKRDQCLYPSIELWPDFGKSGKHYMTGIALVDHPASLGLDEIKLFSRETGNDSNHYCSNFEIKFDLENKDNDKSFIQRLFSINDKNEDDEMSKELVVKAINGMGAVVEKHFEKISSLLDEKDGSVEKDENNKISMQFQKMEEENKVLKTELEGLKEEVKGFSKINESLDELKSDLQKYSEQEIDGTDVPDEDFNKSDSFL